MVDQLDGDPGWDQRIARLVPDTGRTAEEVTKDLLKAVLAGRPAPAEEVRE